jgi:hypothetical protein
MKIKGIILSALFAVIVVCGVALSEYFPDVIVTSPNGLWTDTRAYTTINTAIASIGANNRDIYIVRQEATTTLTIPANISLHFLAAGSIANTGQLSIQTPDIHANNRRIFTGAGEIDFAVGTNLRSSWFANLNTALTQTIDNYVTLIISSGWAGNITADAVVGDNVILKWEGPGNRIVVNPGFTLSNVRNIEAGNYQIFAGAGDFNFLDGTSLNLGWFNRLRTVLGYISTERVTLIVSGTNTVDFDETVPVNVNLDMDSQGIFNIPVGVTLTIDSAFKAGPSQVFSGTGRVSWRNRQPFFPEYWGGRADSTDGNEATATDNSVPFAKSIESLWLGGGGTLQLLGGGQQVNGTGYDGYAYYTSTSILDVDAEVNGGLPDGTTATSNQSIMPITIQGQSLHQSIIKTIGAVTLIRLNGGESGVNGLVAAVNFIGKFHFRDFTLLGDQTAGSYGIHWENRVQQQCSIKNVKCNAFETGFYFQERGWENYIENIKASHNTGFGIRAEDEDSTIFNGVQSYYNEGGGLSVVGGVSNTFSNVTLAYNKTPTLRLSSSIDNDRFNELYMEGAEGGSANYNFIEISTSDGATSQTVQNLIFSNIRVLKGTLDSDKASTLNLFYITEEGAAGTGYIEGLTVEHLTIGDLVNGATGNVYIVNNANGGADAVTLRACRYGPQSVAAVGTAYTAIFNSTTTEKLFSSILDDQNLYQRINTLIPFSVVFSAENLTDNTIDQSIYLNNLVNAAANRLPIPWGSSLVGIGIRTDTVGVGSSVTVTSASLTPALSEAFSTATVQTQYKRYAVGAYVIGASTAFIPLVAVAGVGGNTRDVVVTFFFAINIDEQDRDS